MRARCVDLRMVSPLALLVSGTACGNSPAEFLEVQLEFDGRGTATFDSAPGEKPFRQRCAWDDPAPCDVFSEAPIVGRASAAPGWGFFAWNLLDRSSFESELSFGVAVGGTGARVSGELVFLERDRADPRLLEVPIAARPGERIARGEDVELIAEIPDLPGLRFEWSDGEVGSRPRRWVSNLSETTTFTLDLYANDELLGRGAITIEVTEPGETSWPVEISWDPAGTVTVGGDVAEGSADVTSWTGTVLDRGTVELQASLLDPEGADVFLGWREEASCPVPDPSEPIATLSSVTRAVDCHAEFGAPSHPCGEVDVSQVEASFTIDGIPWDDLPVADPPVHDPSDPSSISLVASVSGVPMEHLVYQWEVKPFHAELDPPWIALQSCRINESSCDWNGTQLFWDDDPVAAGLIRLKVSGCAGEVDETVGPTRNGDGVETYVDFFP